MTPSTTIYPRTPPHRPGAVFFCKILFCEILVFDIFMESYYILKGVKVLERLKVSSVTVGQKKGEHSPYAFSLIQPHRQIKNDQKENDSFSLVLSKEEWRPCPSCHGMGINDKNNKCCERCNGLGWLPVEK